jgi:Tetratricopeptide repeat
LGDYQRAAQLHEQTLTIRERVLGPEHPDTLGSRNNLANALDGLGDYQRAAQLHEQTLTIRERVLGPEHPDTLKSRNLAETLRRAQEIRPGSRWLRRQLRPWAHRRRVDK